MKTIQLYYKILFFFIGVGFLSSCKKSLNVLPTTSVVDGNVITDSVSAKNTLNGVYYRFANGSVDFNGVPVNRWMNIWEIIPSELTGSVVPSGSYDGLMSFTFDQYESGVESMWTYLYAIVNASNGFLENIENVNTISSSAKKEMIAEAKFLRAFANESLLLYFGQYNDTTSQYGIIIRTHSVNTESLTEARSSVAASYTQILADIDAAIPDLPETNTSKLYANRAVAKLLKARVLINRGSTSDLQDVVTITQDIIANEPFNLEEKVQDIFQSKGLSSNEVLLGIQPQPNQNWKFYYYQYNGTVEALDANVNTLFVNDPRNTWYYKPDNEGTNIGGYLGGITEWTKYYSGAVVKPSQTTLSEYSYAFRLSLAYLYQAEALATLNQNLSEAKSLLKVIMGHAGYTDFTDVDNLSSASSIKIAVIKEEIKNFTLENGEDWLAARRLSFDQLKLIQPLIKTESQLIFPIPNAEITKNTYIVQNPDY